MCLLIKELFSYFDEVNKGLKNPILEISIKQSQMVFCFEDLSTIAIPDLMTLNNNCCIIAATKVTAFQDIIHVHFEDLSDELVLQREKNKELKDIPILKLFDFIFRLKDQLCSCPNLEYAISDDYIKIYIDVPNLNVKQLYNIDKLLKSDGILEVNTQRPYILYVKDWQ